VKSIDFDEIGSRKKSCSFLQTTHEKDSCKDQGTVSNYENAVQGRVREGIRTLIQGGSDRKPCAETEIPDSTVDRSVHS